MSERQMDSSEVMSLLQTKLHPRSPELLALFSSFDHIDIEPDADPELAAAARKLVKIGALKVIGAGKMKAITRKDLKEVRLGMVVDFFKAPGFVLTEEPRKAIMKWINGLPQ